MDGFTKIEFSSKDKKDNITATQPLKVVPSNKRLHISKKSLPVVIGLAIFLLLFIVFVVFPGQKVYSSARKTQDQARKAWDAMKKQNVELADTELKKTKDELIKTRSDLAGLSYLGYIPLVSMYYNDAQHLLKAGSSGIEGAITVVESIKPYADVLGLKGKGSFVMGSAEDRIKLAVLTMGKITPRIDDVAKSLKGAKQDIDEVNPNHYPSFLGGGKIKSQLEQLHKITDEGVTFVEEARPLIKVIPSLLGDPKEKKYLVLFQNDKELRPTGGFLTAYAVFSIDRGVIRIDRADDIYTLDNTIADKPKAPDPILKYLPKVYTFNLRDSNLSPDFFESMKTFQSFYEKASGKTSIDGIIALDTHVLVSTIKILDDEIVAGGIKFTTKNDSRCDCPQVIYELEDNISRPVNFQKSGRKDLLGLLLYALMQKSLKSSPKLYWGSLFQDMITQINEKHVLFYVYDKDAQSGMEALNAAGRIVSSSGDYLHINEANFGGAKSNLFVDEAVEQQFKIDGDGTITKTVTINYKNTHAPSDCNLERGGLCLNAPLRDWVRVYVPKGSQLVDSKGSEVKVTTADELGKTMFEGFLTVRPLGSATYTLTYRLPFKAPKDSLSLLIQKQPGTDKNDYTIKVNGKTKEHFGLSTDKILHLSL